MHKNTVILGLALIGVTMCFGCISWFAYEQGRLMGLIRKHINPDRPITGAELRDRAYLLFPNEFAIAKLFVGNVFWQIKSTWNSWGKTHRELDLAARRARFAMCAAIISVASTFAVITAVALIQHAA